jgi:hypothetical protein
MDKSLPDNVGLSPDPLAELAGLHDHDLDSWRAEILRRKALAQFHRSHELASKRWFVVTRKVYRIALEPAFLAAVSSLYLIWAFQTVSALLGLSH